MEDLTLGEVGKVEDRVVTEGMVVEVAHEGKGFQLWKDMRENNEVNLYDGQGKVIGTRKLMKLTR